MARIAAILIASGMVTGCAGTQPRVHVFDGDVGVTLVCGDPDSIDQTCRPEAGPAIGDTGEIIPRGYSPFEKPIKGCFKESKRELWMPWGYFCDLLAHELCHADGQLTQKECTFRYPVSKVL